MSATTPLQERLRSVPSPTPVLDRAGERSLSDRQREILDDLNGVFARGFAHLTMAEIAAQLNCSLRTLYTLAPSRDRLVLMVVDRRLWSIGGAARSAIAPDAAPLDAVRAYLSAANMAVSGITPEFARDMGAVGGRDLNENHSNYLVEMTKCLLDMAVESGEIAKVDTAAAARVIAGLGRDFARPDVMLTLASSPKEAADVMVEVIITGLRAQN